MHLAPIGLSTYHRLDHLRKTVDALKLNPLAKDSRLYVFSDGPKPGDEEAVASVRRYLSGIDGFRETNLIFRDTNDRVYNNREGMRFLLSTYGKMIYLEEDIVTAPGFLQFINQGLNTYESRKDVFAICGYSPPVSIGAYYKKQVYLSPRFSAWGFGFWKDRFEKIVFDRREFTAFLNDPENVRQFSRNGEDLPGKLAMDAKGVIDALDVKIFYTQHKLNLYTIAPTRSLTHNNGHDGSGVHCMSTARYDTDLPNGPDAPVLDKEIKLDPGIVKKLYYFRSNLPDTAAGRLKYKLGFTSRETLRKLKSRWRKSAPKQVQD